MAKNITMKSGIRKEEIIDLALECFASKGLKNTTLRSLARHCDVYGCFRAVDSIA